ncbi:MAG: hypothetical protein DMG65_02940 [Candidatus Angelobacter sp. Gp1-AA117]|nr:MAG: hypothetical protein DMG65_02940 [Candidatus Angelobacter sp. Gp1-AA117]
MWCRAHEITFQETKLSALGMQQPFQTGFAVFKMLFNSGALGIQTAAAILFQVTADLSLC